MEEEEKRDRETPGVQSRERLFTSERKGEQLLPGIPNDITLNHITPKLPWTAFHILPSVSRWWRQAIHGHLVYNARVRANSTETLVVHVHHYHVKFTEKNIALGYNYEEKEVIALYSTSDERCYELPPIPSVEGGTPVSFQCVTLDGKIYLLGGEERRGEIVSPEVYVLDVAGHRMWVKCTSMRTARHNFGSAVVGGKIYVFGGTHYPFIGFEDDNIEVCDPNVNAWSPIITMPSHRYGHQVAAIGEDLFVSGEFCDIDYFKRGTRIPNDWNDWNRHRDQYSRPFFEVYNTVKNKWRSLRTLEMFNAQQMFTSEGKLYRISRFGIDIYGGDRDLWTNLHTCSCPVGSTDSVDSEGNPRAPVAINGEVFVRVGYNSGSQANLLQSKGFKNGNKEIVWQRTNCSSSFDENASTVMSALQL